MLIYGKPLRSGQLPNCNLPVPQGWLLNRGSTVSKTNIMEYNFFEEIGCKESQFHSLPFGQGVDSTTPDKTVETIPSLF